MSRCVAAHAAQRAAHGAPRRSYDGHGMYAARPLSGFNLLRASIAKGAGELHLFWCDLSCLMLAYPAGQHACKARIRTRSSLITGSQTGCTNAMSVVIGKLKRFGMPKGLSSVPEGFLR